MLFRIWQKSALFCRKPTTVSSIIVPRIELAVKSTHSVCSRGPECLMNKVEMGNSIGIKRKTPLITTSSSNDLHYLTNYDQAETNLS